MSSEKEYLDSLERYKNIKEIADLYDDVKKLRNYYYNGQYGKMQQHIQSLMLKYPAETLTWNSSYTVAPQTPEQSYKNTVAFLFTKIQALAIEKGLKL